MEFHKKQPFLPGHILEQFDAMVMNIANSHRLSEVATFGGHYGVVKTQVEWAPQCACKTVHSLIFRATERRAFEVKIPVFLFWKNNILPVGTWFYRSAMYSPWFWPKRTRRHDFLSSQSDISSCFAEM